MKRGRGQHLLHPVVCQVGQAREVNRSDEESHGCCSHGATPVRLSGGGRPWPTVADPAPRSVAAVDFRELLSATPARLALSNDLFCRCFTLLPGFRNTRSIPIRVSDTGFVRLPRRRPTHRYSARGPMPLGLPGGHGDRVVAISIANLLWGRAMGGSRRTLSGRMDRNLEDHQSSMLAPFYRQVHRREKDERRRGESSKSGHPFLFSLIDGLTVGWLASSPPAQADREPTTSRACRRLRMQANRANRGQQRPNKGTAE